MSHKDEALQDIVSIAVKNNITLDDISNAMNNLSHHAPRKSPGVLSKLLAYLGGIFLFAGVCVFIAMQWNHLGSAPRVIITLGVGFFSYVMGLVCLTDKAYERAAAPFFLVSLLLEPTGIFVMLIEYGSGGDPRHGILFMASYMLIQHGAAFWSKQRTVLAFSALLFGCIFFVTLFDLWQIDGKIIGLILSISAMCISYALDRSLHARIAAFWYLVSSLCLLYTVFDIVERTPFEIIFLGTSGLIMFLSTYLRSQTLLFVSTLSMLAYIDYFTEKHFAHTVGWSIVLIIIGVAFILLSVTAVKLNNKFIKAKR